MIRHPPRSTRTDTRLPSTTLVRSLPGDLGRPILDAQNRGQPIAPPAITTPNVDPEEQRRMAEEEAARLSRVFFQTAPGTSRSDEHTSELQSLMRNSYAVFCLKHKISTKSVFYV